MSVHTLRSMAVLLAALAAGCDRVPTQPPAVAEAAGPSTATEVRSACLDEPVPEGFVILSYEATSQCPYRNGFWNARRIGVPAPRELVCRDSPTPAGWVRIQYLHSDECRFAGSPQNAARVEPGGWWPSEACLAGPIPADLLHFRYSRRPDCPGYADSTRFNSVALGYDEFLDDMPAEVCATGPRPRAYHIAWRRRANCRGYSDSTRFNSITVKVTQWENEEQYFPVCVTSRVIPHGLLQVSYGRRPDCPGYADTTRFNTLTLRYPSRWVGWESVCRVGGSGGWEIVSYGFSRSCPGGGSNPNRMTVVMDGLEGSDVVCFGSPGMGYYAHAAYSGTARCGSSRVTNTVTLSWHPQPGDTICATSPRKPPVVEPVRSRKCRNYSATGFNAWRIGGGVQAMAPAQPLPSRSIAPDRGSYVELAPGDLRIPIG
jgi:hypothetical protein